MALQVAELSLELIETLRPLMPRIKQRDKSLADQIQRSASSIALNLGEAELSDPGN
jgi:four helix bundle protein